MGHNLDITDGKANFADSRTDAWHQLGQQVGHAMTVSEALEAAHMTGWNVRTVPHRADVATRHDADGQLLDVQPDPVMVDVPNEFVILRTNPHTKAPQALGTVGRWWKPFQNEATTPLLADITESSGAHIETIGALDEGRKTFATMLLPDHMELTAPNGFRDVTQLYLAIFNNHDGKGALRALISPTRVVCANTQRIAEANAVSEVKIRHTGDMDIKMTEVRRLLGLTFKYQETFATEMEAMSRRERDDVWVRQALNEVFGADDADTDKQRANRLHTAGLVMEVYRKDDTVNMWQGTQFGAYNAVTRYLDHYMPVGGATTRRKGNDADKRAQRTLLSSSVNELKARAFTVLSAV